MFVCPFTLMNILFLCPYPHGEAPSQRFRFEQYFQVLEKENCEYSVSSFLDMETWDVLYEKGHFAQKTLGILKGFFRRCALIFDVKKFDKIFIHREVAPLGPPVFEWILAKVYRKKIIYDFDDAIWMKNTSDENAIASALKWHSKVSSICKWSSHVSVGNAFLTDYASQFNASVTLNPTTIDTNTVHVPSHSDNSVPVIGWTGTHSTGKYLTELLPVLGQIYDQHKFKFLYISNKAPDVQFPNMEFVKWNKESETADLNRIDIGLMPLQDDAWAQGKCGFKALQYMALEIPALVSPVGVNSDIVENGIHGFHCTTEKDWKMRIIEMLQQPELRDILGKNGRKKVIAEYSVQSNTQNFMRIIKS